jgi:hypothetical protein
MTKVTNKWNICGCIYNFDTFRTLNHTFRDQNSGLVWYNIWKENYHFLRVIIEVHDQLRCISKPNYVRISLMSLNSNIFKSIPSQVHVQKEAIYHSEFTWISLEYISLQRNCILSSLILFTFPLSLGVNVPLCGKYIIAATQRQDKIVTQEIFDDSKINCLIN